MQNEQSQLVYQPQRSKLNAPVGTEVVSLRYTLCQALYTSFYQNKKVLTMKPIVFMLCQVCAIQLHYKVLKHSSGLLDFLTELVTTSLRIHTTMPTTSTGNSTSFPTL